MAKSKIRLPDGTLITVEGSVEEINKIISVYQKPRVEIGGQETSEKKDKKSGGRIAELPEGEEVIMGVVNEIKDSDKSEAIEKNILERSSQVDRVLLPLYVGYGKYGSKFALTTGQISKILQELGTPISMANAGSVLAGSARKYVVGDKTRRKGMSVKYRITLRGQKYLSAVIKESDNDK